MKETVLRKLGSRKFWLSFAAFATSVILCFNAPPDTTEKVTGIITAFGSVVVYVLSEAVVDSAHKEDDE